MINLDNNLYAFIYIVFGYYVVKMFIAIVYNISIVLCELLNSGDCIESRKKSWKDYSIKQNLYGFGIVFIIVSIWILGNNIKLI